MPAAALEASPHETDACRTNRAPHERRGFLNLDAFFEPL